jgi:hypothetical protein
LWKLPVCWNHLPRSLKAKRYSITAACNAVQAKSIVELRPFASEAEIRRKLQRKKGVSPRYFDDYIRILEGYSSVDGVIEKCEKVGKELSDILAVWASLAEPTADSSTSGSGEGTGINTPTDTAGVNIVAVDAGAVKAKVEAMATDPTKAQALEGYMNTQPATLAEQTVLKDYQLLGVNWLSLLHRRKLSCILADEMGTVDSTLPRIVAPVINFMRRRPGENDPSDCVLLFTQGKRLERPSPCRSPVSPLVPFH